MSDHATYPHTLHAHYRGEPCQYSMNSTMLDIAAAYCMLRIFLCPNVAQILGTKSSQRLEHRNSYCWDIANYTGKNSRNSFCWDTGKYRKKYRPRVESLSCALPWFSSDGIFQNTDCPVFEVGIHHWLPVESSPAEGTRQRFYSRSGVFSTRRGFLFFAPRLLWFDLIWFDFGFWVLGFGFFFGVFIWLFALALSPYILHKDKT